MSLVRVRYIRVFSKLLKSRTVSLMSTLKISKSKNPDFVIVAVMLVVLIVTPYIETERAGEASTGSLIVFVRGIRWNGNPTVLWVTARLGPHVKSANLTVDRGAPIECSFEFLELETPSSFMLNVIEGGKEVFHLEVAVLKGSIRVTRIYFKDDLISPYGEDLLEFIFVGRFYNVELLFPVRLADVHAEAWVDGTPVISTVMDHDGSLKVEIKDVLLIQEPSTFQIILRSQNSVITTITGSVSQSGVHEIKVSGGVVESVHAKVSVTTGRRKAVVPTSIMNLHFFAEEALQVVKITDLVITSSEIIVGSVPVRLLAFSRGTLFRPEQPINSAVFEVTLVRYGITKLYRFNDTAYLPVGEEVSITASAEGYIPVEKVFLITNETREIVFYLSETTLSPVESIWNQLERITSHRLFMPIVVGLLAGLIILAILRKR